MSYFDPGLPGRRFYPPTSDAPAVAGERRTYAPTPTPDPRVVAYRARCEAERRRIDAAFEARARMERANASKVTVEFETTCIVRGVSKHIHVTPERYVPVEQEQHALYVARLRMKRRGVKI